MKKKITQSTLIAIVIAIVFTANAQNYEVYTTFNGVRPANPVITKNGSVFVTMHPIDNADIAIMKVDKNGNHSPFPNKEWASKPNNGIGIANAIGIRTSEENKLYILDMGNEFNQAKIVCWDLTKNKLDRLYYIPTFSTNKNSFLQDFALDQKRGFIYIADMGRADFFGEQVPAIIALNLKTGQTKRLLEKHKTFMATQKTNLIDGKPLSVLTPNGSKELNLGLNPITIDPNYEYLYYSTLDAGFIYRIKASELSDFNKTDLELALLIEEYGPKPLSDGISVDAENNVYITSLSENGIGVTTKGKYQLLFSSPELSWLDGISYAPDGYFYATVNQLHKSGAFNAGTEMGTKPYKLIRFKSLGKNTIGR
jgi:sugar lactone lactonase YvrE